MSQERPSSFLSFLGSCTQRGAHPHGQRVPEKTTGLFGQHCFHCSGLGQGKPSVRVVLYQKRQCIASCFLGQSDYRALYKSLCYFSFK